MAFSWVELVMIGLVILVPTILGVILVFAAVLQKTGTSDVLSWSSSASGGSDPYDQVQDEEREAEAGEGDEESLYSDYDRRRQEAASQQSRSDDMMEEAERQSEYESEYQPERTPARSYTDRTSDHLSEYTYEY